MESSQEKLQSLLEVVKQQEAKIQSNRAELEARGIFINTTSVRVEGFQQEPRFVKRSFASQT